MTIDDARAGVLRAMAFLVGLHSEDWDRIHRGSEAFRLLMEAHQILGGTRDEAMFALGRMMAGEGGAA